MSPGLDLNHYQPNIPVRINAKKQQSNEGWLGFGKLDITSKSPSMSLSKKKCLKEASRNLYKMLRILDKKKNNYNSSAENSKKRTRLSTKRSII